MQEESFPHESGELVPLLMCLFPGDWPQRHSEEMHEAEWRGGIRSLAQRYTHPLRHLPPTQDHARYVRVLTTCTTLNTCKLRWEWRQGYCRGLTHALSVYFWKMPPTESQINRCISSFKSRKYTISKRNLKLTKFTTSAVQKCPNLSFPPPPASQLPSLLLWLRQCSQKKSVGPLTTGTVMCNYRVTPGCPSPIPPPLSSTVCVSSPSAHDLHTHAHLVSHTGTEPQHRPPCPCRGF